MGNQHNSIIYKNVKCKNIRCLMNKLLGQWFLYRTYDADLPLHNNDCIKFIHRLRPDGNIKTLEISKNIATNTVVGSPSNMIFDRKNEGHYLYQPKGEFQCSYY